MPDFLGHSDWRLGLGTYRLGPKTEYAVTTALRLGYRHIDTAALYRNEAAVASAIAASGIPRSQICVGTKIHVRDIDRLTIRTATEAALARLGEIDILMLHAWRPNAPEAWALISEEMAAGRVRMIGVSNFGIDDLASLGSPQPVLNQIELSPFLPRRPLRTFCEEAGIATVAHSPLTKTQRFSDIRRIQGIRSPAQILAAWALANASSVLLGSSNEEHLRENISALDVELSPSQSRLLQSMADGYSTHPNVLRG